MATPELAEPHHLERLRHAPLAFRAVHLPHHQAVGDVVTDRHVREERVILEDGVHVALERRHTGDVAAVEQDATGGRPLEAGDHAQVVVLPEPEGPSMLKNSRGRS